MTWSTVTQTEMRELTKSESKEEGGEGGGGMDEWNVECLVVELAIS